ncbi:MAG: hypothetical protein IPK83_22265 [Planctomycetes bacterium]|nr:hypothetical protein [Planctomycetota bacterium]
MPELAQHAQQELAELEQQFASDKLAASREWFLALHSIESLQDLHSRFEESQHIS